MEYLLDALSDDDALVSVLDTRGTRASPLTSAVPLARVWLRLVGLGAARRVDVAHVNISVKGSMARKTVMVWTCRALGIPVVLHLHAAGFEDFYRGLSRLAQAAVCGVFRRAHVVVTLGAEQGRFLEEQLGVQSSQIRVIRNAAPGPIAERPLGRRNGRPLSVLFVGRLGERKGVSALLQSLGSVRMKGEDWTATLAGDGDVDFYRGEAARLHIQDRLTFTGWVDTPTVRGLFDQADILVLPSHAEGLPMAVIEAFAHAVPVVATRVGAIPEVVFEGVNGTLVDQGDSTALADALYLLSRDDALRLRLAEGARDSWRKQFGMTAYSQALLDTWWSVSRRGASNGKREAVVHA
jgi:glycosyltransferase involved in cell wall biosynthesis